MFLNLIKRYRNARDGNFSIMFVLFVMTCLSCVGLAIDVSGIRNAKGNLNDVADASALAAVRFKAMGLNDAEKRAIELFDNNISAFNEIKVDNFDVEVVNGGNNAGFTATVQYLAEIRPSFMSLFGFKTVKVRGIASAQMDEARKNKVLILVDNSASMGIGADDDDQKTTKETTGCALACHFTSTPNKPTSLDKARAAGAVMRIDVVRDVVSDLLGRFNNPGATNWGSAKKGVSELAEIEIYAFSNDLAKVYGPGNDIDKAASLVKKIDVARVDYSGGTNLHYVLDKIRKNTEGENYKKYNYYTIILTDGLEDSIMEYDVKNPGRKELRDPNFTANKEMVEMRKNVETQPLDTKYCTALKDLGHEIYIVNMEYLIQDSWLVDKNFRIVDEMRPQLENSLLECAGDSSRVAMARSPEEIRSAIEIIFGKVSQRFGPRLTH